jgi:SAM-dependent methyltransferase
VNEKTQLDISPNDTMFEGDREHYVSVGQSALHCIKAAMVAADKSSVRKVLDFGSGFGRVLRALKAAFPEAEFTASDILAEAVNFCAKTFGARPVSSSQNAQEIRIHEKFDLIWCGTLLTQFDSTQFQEFLKLFQSLLTTDGLLVFTTHGPFVARRLRERTCTYGMDEKSVLAILSGYDGTGFGYADYPPSILQQIGMTKYGISAAKPSWVCRQIEYLPNLRLVSYTERAWDNHQDSIACSNRRFQA